MKLSFPLRVNELEFGGANMTDTLSLRRIEFKFTREVRELQLAELAKRLLGYDKVICASCLKSDSTTWFPFLDRKGIFWLCGRCYSHSKLSTVRNCANCSNLKVYENGYFECNYHKIPIIQPYHQVCAKWSRISFPP